MNAENISFEVLASQRHTLGETPVWCGERGLLWWVDIRAPSLCCWDSANGFTRSWPMPQLAGAVVTTSRQRLTAQALADEPLAGAVLALRVGVTGLAETPYAG